MPFPLKPGFEDGLGGIRLVEGVRNCFFRGFRAFRAFPH